MTSTAAPAADPRTLLIEQLGVLFTRYGIGFERAPGAAVLVADLDGSEFSFEAGPGLIHAYCDLLDADGQAEQTEAITLLEEAVPIPTEWAAVADYREDAEGDSVGLFMELPMPATFSPALIYDAIRFASETQQRVRALAGS